MEGCKCRMENKMKRFNDYAWVTDVNVSDI